MGSWLCDLRRGGETFVRYRVTGVRPELSSTDLAWACAFRSRESSSLGVAVVRGLGGGTMW